MQPYPRLDCCTTRLRSTPLPQAGFEQVLLTLICFHLLRFARETLGHVGAILSWVGLVVSRFARLGGGGENAAALPVDDATMRLTTRRWSSMGIALRGTARGAHPASASAPRDHIGKAVGHLVRQRNVRLRLPLFYFHIFHFSLSFPNLFS